MRILVLGGTWFVGRAIVEDALRSGERGEPPLTRGFSPEAEQALLAQRNGRPHPPL